MFFDPLGLISPITSQPKPIPQELYRNKLERGEIINDRNISNKLVTLQDMFFVARVEMSSCTGLATVQGRHMGIVCFLRSAVNMGLQSGCGQVNIGLLE